MSNILTENTDLPRILFHFRGSMSFDEANFLLRFRKACQEQGFDLWVVAHHRPQTKVDVPIMCVANGLEMAGSLVCTNGWISYLPENKDPYNEELLARECLWHGKEKNAQMLNCRKRGIEYFWNFYQRVVHIVQPVLTIIWNGHHPQEMILNRLVDSPVLYIERSPFQGGLHFDLEGVLGGSGIAKRDSWEWGNPEEQSCWVSRMNSLQESYRKQRNTWWKQPKSVGGDVLRKQLNISDGKKVIFFAGQVDADIQNFLYSPSFSSNLNAFEWICKNLEFKSDVFILGKHHPKSEHTVSEYKNIAPANAIWTDRFSVADCLDVADAVVAVNSTVMYEALMQGLPVLSMGQSLLANKGIAYEIDDLNDAGNVINGWLSSDDLSERLERWIDFGAWLLSTDVFFMNDSHNLQGVNELAKRCASFTNKEGALQLPAERGLAAMLEASSMFNLCRQKTNCNLGIKWQIKILVKMILRRISHLK